MADRTIVRGRRGAPAVDRLPLNDSGYEQQPTRFNSGMWAIIMFVAVRIGGPWWLPFPSLRLINGSWHLSFFETRWGYGWRYPRYKE